MGYRSDSIAVSHDMGPLSRGAGVCSQAKLRAVPSHGPLGEGPLSELRLSPCLGEPEGTKTLKPEASQDCPASFLRHHMLHAACKLSAYSLIERGQTCNNKRAKWFGLFLFILLKKALLLRKVLGEKFSKNSVKKKNKCLKGSKGHTRKGHREKHPENTLKNPEIHDIQCFFPMPFVGMPFAPFQSVEKCRKSVEKVPKRFCPLVVAL